MPQHRRGRTLLLVLALVLTSGALVALAVRGRVLQSPAAPAAPGEASRAPETKPLYHCPMHPRMVSDRPGDCPICGMRMVPVTIEPAAEKTVEGRAPISIPSSRQQIVGIRTEIARRGPFVRRIRATGRVIVDETRLHHVHTKVEGWVETLSVNSTGVRVERGEPLLSLYSPELLATQEEFLLALRAWRSARDGGLAEAADGDRALLESARRRLLLFDLTPAQIARLEESGAAERTVTLYAPMSGYVLMRNVTHGERIDPATNLLDIADLSRVWVVASIYEYELPFVRAGQPASMRLSYVPGKVYQGRTALVYPVLDSATRAAQVRLEFANPDLDLKPEMFAEVTIDCDLGPRLSVPEAAVIATGTRDLVFVSRADGSFEPRAVTLGLRLPDAVEITGGLAEGETVVSAAAFLVDSESRLKAALLEAAPPPAGAKPSGAKP